MRDPLRNLRSLPWRSLLLVSVLTNISLTPLELLLALGYSQSLIIGRLINFLYAPPLGLLTPLAISVGIGAFSVYLLERYYQQVRLNTGTLWALVLCLAVVTFVKLKLPLPSILVDFQTIQLVGIAVGVFWKGRPYWRY